MPTFEFGLDDGRKVHIDADDQKAAISGLTHFMQQQQQQKQQPQPAPPQQQVGGAGQEAMQAPLLRAGQQRAQQLPANLKAGIGEGIEQLAAQDKDIDYNTGGPIPMRVNLQKASNPEEQRLTLEKSVGPGNFGQDRFGQWWIKQNGKRVSVLPKGVTGAFKNLSTEMLAGSWPMAGAVAGGILGEVAMPAGGGIPGAMVGAMAGAMAGKGIDDLIKWTQGVFAKTPQQEVSGLATEGAIAGVFQGAAPLTRQGMAAAQRTLQRFTGVTPTTATMAGELSGSGAVPPIGGYAPGATAVEYKRQLRNQLAGMNPAEAKNVSYLTGRLDNMLKSQMIAPQEREQIIKNVYDTLAATSPRAAGEKIAGEAKRIHDALLTEVSTIRNRIETAFTQTHQGLERMAQAPASTAQDVAVAIQKSRREFGKQMGQLYQSIDNMTGGQKVVPTNLIKAQAKELVQVIPPQALPPIIKAWAEKGAPKNITFAQAHALRTTFREMGELSDVAPTGQKIGNVRRLAAATNEAINATTNAVGQQAAAALKAADAQYSAGIAKFDNPAINKLVRDLRSGIVPEPTQTANLILRADNPNLARTVFAMLPQPVQNNVVKAELNNLIQGASFRGARGELQLDGQTLLRLLDERKPVADAIYPQVRDNLQRHATDLAAFDGKVDVTNIKSPTAITNLLERAVGAARAADEFARNNPIGALTAGTPMQVDRAVAYLTQPGKEAVTEQAALTLGISSPAWQELQKNALQKLFAGAARETTALSKTISGPEIEKRLARYTKKQQDLLFPGGLADDVRLLAQEAKFLFPEHVHDLGTSLAAAAIKSKLWLNPLAVWKYIRFNVIGALADRPEVLRFLTSEIKRDRVQARTLLGVMGQWLAERAIEGGPGSAGRVAQGIGGAAAAPFMIQVPVPRWAGGPKQDQSQAPQMGGPMQ